VSQWGKIEALQERILADGRVGAEEMIQLSRLKGAVYSQMQAQYELEKVAADVEAIGYQEWQVGAERMRTGATVASGGDDPNECCCGSDGGDGEDGRVSFDDESGGRGDGGVYGGGHERSGGGGDETHAADQHDEFVAGPTHSRG